MAWVRRLTQADMELSRKRWLQQGGKNRQHDDTGFPWTSCSKQERTASNPRVKATNDDLFISGRDLKINSRAEDEEYDPITIFWIKGHKYTFFSRVMQVVFGLRDVIIFSKI